MADVLGNGSISLVVFDNVNSDRVKRYRSLQQASARKRHGLFLVEGPNAVRELVGSGPDKLEALFLTESAAKRYPEFADIFERSAENFDKPFCPITIATEQVINTISENAQGVLAVVKTDRFSFGQNYESADEVIIEALPHYNNKGEASGPALIAILNNIRDPGNAGTVIRTADAMGADLTILTGDSVEITNPKVIRSSAGSLFHAPVIAYQNLPDIVQALKKHDWQVLAATGAVWPCVSILDPALNLDKPTAWIFGNEAWGLKREDSDLADERVAIPIYGNAESLNLAIAAAICLYATASVQRKGEFPDTQAFQE